MWRCCRKSFRRNKAIVTPPPKPPRQEQDERYLEPQLGKQHERHLDENKTKQKKQIDLFEVLEDRYAYEGFNRFVFLSFMYFATYQWLLSSFHYNDAAGQNKIIRDLLTPEEDQFERNEYNEWCLQGVKSMIDDLDYFGDRFKLTRVAVYMEPTLCNSSKQHPRGFQSINGNYRNGIHEASLAKSYEAEYGCPAVSEMDSVNGLKHIADTMERRYKVYSLPRWPGVMIPLFSAEIDKRNISNIAYKQLDGVKAALDDKTNYLRLRKLSVELLNPYDQVWYHAHAVVDDKTTKTFKIYIGTTNITPRVEDILYILWGIIVGMCFMWLWHTVGSKIIRKIEKSDKKWGWIMEFNMLDIFEYFCVVVGVFMYLYLLFLNFAVIGPKGILMNEFGSVATIQKTTTYDEHINLFFSRGHHNKIFLSLWFLLNMFLMIRELSWHSGTSVFINTLAYAFGEIMDALFVVSVLLLGFGGAGYGLFGAFGGSADFHSLASSINTMARLAFGMYDYDLYMSDGLGPKYDGIGLGEMAFFKYIMLWLTFLFLSILVINLFISIVSEGYERHKDDFRFRTKNGETFVQYFVHRLIYVLLFQIFRCCEKRIPHCYKNYQPSWVKQLHFTSSAHAEMLLHYSISFSAIDIFDEKLQLHLIESFFEDVLMHDTVKDIIEEINGNKNDQRNKESFKKDRNLKCDTARNFFSNIKSDKHLERILDNLVAYSENLNAKSTKVSMLVKRIYCYSKRNKPENFSQYASKRIWSHYKQEAEDGGANEKSAGNHVRVVVDHMLKRSERRMEDKMEILKEEVERHMDKVDERFEQIRLLLETRQGWYDIYGNAHHNQKSPSKLQSERKAVTYGKNSL